MESLQNHHLFRESAGVSPALPTIALAITCAILLAAVAVWGSPFLLDYLNSGDQLPPTLQIVEPQLFPDDAVVAAMGRLKSGFYLALAALMKLANIPARQTESVVYALFFVSKILLIAAAFAITWALTANKTGLPGETAWSSGFSLLSSRSAPAESHRLKPELHALLSKENLWFFVVFAAWCCHQKPALLGSVTLFLPMITHNEAALVLGMFAVACLLRGHIGLFWLLSGIAVLVHVLVGLHFMLCFAPVILWRRQFGKSFWIGLAIFAGCCAAYLLTMTPPPLTPAEWQLFLSANGHTAHISLFKHGWLDWFGFASFFGLALFAHDRFLKGNSGFDLIRRAAISGSAFGLLLSLAAVTSRAMKLMLFQPMRVFFWVTLLCFLLIAAATVEAFRRSDRSSRLAGMFLAAALALTVLNSILAPLFAFVGLCYFIAERLLGTGPGAVATGCLQGATFTNPPGRYHSRSRPKKIETVAQVVLTMGVLGIIAAWALGNRQPVNSLRSPVLLLPGIICLAILFLPRLKNWRVPVAALLIVYCLTAASIYRHDYAKRWTDPDWRAVRLWVQSNTDPSDRFLTPPDQVGFRALALRTTASESLPRVIWAAPFIYLENKQAAERAAKGYTNTASDVDYLFGLAREWRCQYVIARGSYDAKFAPAFRSGEFSVLKTLDQL